MRKMPEYLFLFALGGAAYYMIELLFRGFSHPTMFVLGGICFLLCCAVHEIVPDNTGIYAQMFLCALIITTMELIFGYIFNLKLGMHIWSYQEYRFNFKGQICLLFSFIWYGLSGIALIVCDYVRYFFYGGCKPSYGAKPSEISKAGGREQKR